MGGRRHQCHGVSLEGAPTLGVLKVSRLPSARLTTRHLARIPAASQRGSEPSPDLPSEFLGIQIISSDLSRILAVPDLAEPCSGYRPHEHGPSLGMDFRRSDIYASMFTIEVSFGVIRLVFSPNPIRRRYRTLWTGLLRWMHRWGLPTRQGSGA